MPKALLLDLAKCVCCGTCEMVCSLKHERAVNPFRSRIKVISQDIEWEGVPIACVQCEEAQCAAICPVKAISRDESLGRLLIDYDRCTGCRMCVTACPFGLINFDGIGKRVIKCDLCDGDPECAKFCAYEAMQYVDAGDLATQKRMTTAELLSGLFRKAR